MKITFNEPECYALRDMVEQWISEGFTTPPYTDAQYGVFELLGLAHDHHTGVSYDTRRPDETRHDSTATEVEDE